MNLWHISEETFDPTPKKLHSQETVYTIGNGYFCTRGTFEEGYRRANPATLIFGVFDEIPIAREELANAPDWTAIGLSINNERFRLDTGKLLSYQRTLDLQQGLLTRSIRWESPTGLRLRIQSERFASLADEHLGIIRYNVTAEELPGQTQAEIAIWANFNVAVGNYDVMHWETTDQGAEQDLVWLQSETKRSQVQLAQAMSFTGTTSNQHREIVPSYIAPSIRIFGTITQGETITAEKVVVMHTSRDSENPLRSALDHLQSLVQSETTIYEQQLKRSSEAWQDFWRTADILIEGDEKAQLGIRYNIYQLRINASSHDNRYSIAAKGLTGFGYRGHVFHDTEIFMLPFFIYVLPEIARNLIIYRYNLLPGARQKAKANGQEGAQYPWESTLDGLEATPPAIIHPETGEIVAVLNGQLELHITANIAMATWEYWRVSGDDAFMIDYGAEILLSTATFWASRAEYNAEHKAYEYKNVIGPDEWHEHVNNNTYTNYMARWNIRSALTILDWLHTHAPEKSQTLQSQLDITKERLDHWHDVSEHIVIVQDLQTKVYEQFEGFFKLLPLDQDKYKGRKDSYQGLLGVDDVQKYQIVKQADVLMLLTVLGREFDLETKRANWNYYYPITDHDYGSSLTPALHTILACELGQTEAAYRQFVKGNLVDLENLRGNTPEGIHAACSGAVWQAVVLGFAGLRVTDEGYTTSPHWPENWTRLAFTIHHKGQPIYIDLHR